MGVNLGGLIGPLVTGALWGWKGFHWGFAAAALGMALGLAQYLLLRRGTIGDIGNRASNPLRKAEAPRYLLFAGVGVAAIVIAGLMGWLQAERLAGIVVMVTLVATVALFAVILSSKKITEAERSRVVSFIPMFIASATFWSLFQQQFTIIVVYADQRLNRDVFGFEISPAWVNSINPIFIVIFAGVFAAMWTKLGDRQPSTPLKFAAGTFIMGVAFLLFIPYAGGGANSTPLMWIVLILFLFRLAELFLSPVGQSLATKLAPEAFKTQMIALFFLSVAVGSAMAGVLKRWYTEETEVAYSLAVGGGSILVAVVMVLLNKWIVKKMAGVR